MIDKICVLLTSLSYTIGTTIIGLLATETESFTKLVKDVGFPGAILFFVLGTAFIILKRLVDLIGEKLANWLGTQIELAAVLKNSVENEKLLDQENKAALMEIRKELAEIKTFYLKQYHNNDEVR